MADCGLENHRGDAVAQLRRFLRRLVTLFRPGKAEADLAREIDAHLQMLEDGFVDTGMSREDARYAARRAFGGVEQAKERQRDERSFRWLAGWPMDLRLGVRMLAKTPGLTVVGVVALAVAIGAGAAYLEFTRDMLAPTLRVPGADRIVGIRVWDTERNSARMQVLRDFAVWRANARTLEDIGASRDFARHLITDDGRTESARGVEISASAFRIVPAAPVLGRALVEDDERPDAEPVAVIGHDLWQARFGADPGVAGRTVRLGSTVYTIVGVMPAGFAFPVNHNLWTPLRAPAAGVKRGEGPYIAMFGRLKEGIGADAARAELQGLLNADAGAALRADVRPYLDSLLAEDRNSAEVAIVHAANVVFMMLLGICGANVATLVFARTALREAEITVRTALGATRSRISAQLFAEALVLSSLGAAAGLVIARSVGLWGKQMWMEGTGMPRPFWWDDALSPETILYAAVLAVLAALIVGVVPALKATGRHLQGRLREAGAAGSSMKFGGLWTGVIVVQAGLTVLFLATVVSLGWTVLRGLYGLDVTYAREQFMTARVELEGSTAGAEGARRTSDALQRITGRLKSEAGVVDATYASSVPGTTWESFAMEFAAPEAARDAKVKTDVLWSESARVGPRFFETVGIPLVAGRYFRDVEVLGGHNVAIVDETFVRTILGGRNALGLMVRETRAEAGGPGPWHEIVGVVRDVTLRTRKGPDDACLYRPAGTAASTPMRLLVRTQGSASQLAHRLQSAAVSANADVRLVDAMPLDRLAAEEALPMRFFLRIFVVIAAIAMLLSTAGIYALISFTLARRTREIGIRIALGAAPRRIITSVFSRAFVQIGLGVLAGAIPGLVILRDGVDDTGQMGTATGMAVALGVCAFVILVALVSCAAPLRKTLRIEPTQALRADA